VTSSLVSHSGSEKSLAASPSVKSRSRTCKFWRLKNWSVFDQIFPIDWKHFSWFCVC
jgi:hypothetical protein